ncbi:MAG: site-2 protease family protein [Bacteroidota bacterium]
MKKQNPLIRIAGIGVYIHWSFSLLILYIIYTNAKAGLDPVQISWSVLFVLSMFLCVLLHEFGHAMAARRYGIKTQDITLYPIGGVARLERIPEKPVHELVVSIAGPLVNVAIVILLIPVWLQQDAMKGFVESSGVITPSNFLPALAFLNIWLALFNLIPAFPMDGGRILRALLAMRLSRLKATSVAVFIGKLLAGGFIIAGFFYNPFLILIGLFVILGAHSELEMVRQKEMVTGLTAKDAMMLHWTELDSEQPLSIAVDTLLASEAKSFLVVESGSYVGTLNRDGIIKALREKGDLVSIGEICSREISYADFNTPLDEVFERFRNERMPLILVMEKGALIGVIDAENIAELILIKQARNTA